MIMLFAAPALAGPEHDFNKIKSPDCCRIKVWGTGEIVSGGMNANGKCEYAIDWTFENMSGTKADIAYLVSCSPGWEFAEVCRTEGYGEDGSQLWQGCGGGMSKAMKKNEKVGIGLLASDYDWFKHNAAGQVFVNVYCDCPDEGGVEVVSCVGGRNLKGNMRRYGRFTFQLPKIPEAMKCH